MPQGAILFNDKIRVPPCPKGFVRRNRLVELLHQVIDRRLILVSAPAGFGKTSVLADFASDAPFPVCWYSLDRSDADLNTFLTHLIGSLQKRFPRLGNRTLKTLALARAGDYAPFHLATQLMEEINKHATSYFTLILDDYHCIDQSDEVNQVLDILLEHLGDHASVILSGRTLPQKIRVSRLAAANQAVGLGVDDLAFTAEEIKMLMEESLGVAVSAQEADRIHEYSRGWIAALALSKDIWPSRQAGSLAVLARSPSDLFDYVSEEVIAQLPDEAVDFLLRSSVLPRVLPAWCDELLEREGSSRFLADLTNQVLFISPKEGPPVHYEYHSLFRDYLRSKLRASGPELFGETHYKAALIAEREGLPENAIDLCVSGGMRDEAMAFLKKHTPQFLLQGKWTFLKEWLSHPELADAIEEEPELLLVKARVEERTGDTDAALIDCMRARTIYRRKPDSVGESHALATHARILNRKGEFATAGDVASEAMEFLSPDDRLHAAQLHEVMGLSLRHTGRGGEALRELDLALKCAQEADDPTLQASIERNLATVYLASDRLEDAYRHYRAAQALASRAGDVALEGAAINGQGIIHGRWGNYDESNRLYFQALQQVRAVGTHPQFEAMILRNISENYKETREYQKCVDFCREAVTIARRIDDKFLMGAALYSSSEAYRLQGRLLDAEMGCQEANRWASESGARQYQGLAELCLGALASVYGDVSRAKNHYTNALRILNEVKAPRELIRASIRYGMFLISTGRLKEGISYVDAGCSKADEFGQSTIALVELSEHPTAFLESLRHEKKLSPSVLRAIDQSIAWCNQYSQASAAAIPLPVTDESAARAKIQVQALGSASVRVGGKHVAMSDWGSVTAREMFYFLLLHPAGIRKEQVVSALWPDLSGARGNSQFHSNVYRLRRAIGAAAVVLRDGKYMLAPAAEMTCDHAEFEALMQRALMATDEDIKAALLTEAVAMYGGPYLEECYADWCVAVRERLQNLFLRGVLNLASYHESKGDFPRSIDLAQRALSVDFSLDSVHLYLISLWVRTGQPMLAAQHFEHFSEWCDRELGAEPPEELEAVYRAALKLLQK